MRTFIGPPLPTARITAEVREEPGGDGTTEGDPSVVAVSVEGRTRITKNATETHRTTTPAVASLRHMLEA
jgi:hypothetical protein